VTCPFGQSVRRKIVAPGVMVIPSFARACSERSRSFGVMRSFALPLNVRSMTMASPIMASSGSCSMPGMSRKKWCGVSMWVPACTVISTTLDTKPFSSHFTIGFSLK